MHKFVYAAFLVPYKIGLDLSVSLSLSLPVSIFSIAVLRARPPVMSRLSVRFQLPTPINQFANAYHTRVLTYLRGFFNTPIPAS